MKIGHFAIFAPHQSGQYGTVRDLVLAEREIGIDAQFIDYGTKGDTVREGLVDGDIRTAPLEWALKEADVVVRHTAVPQKVYDSKPVILALHGRPENSFRLEQLGKHPVISSIMTAFRDGRHAAAFTFWQEYVFFWQRISNGLHIDYVPSLVNFNDFTPEGLKHDFGKFKGSPNLVIADMWREDYIPFNLIFAAQYFRERYCPTARLHIFGVSEAKKNKGFSFLAPLQKTGVVGEVSGVTGKIAEIYRAADILLTPNIIATRIIREAMASGLPIVAPVGCQYTEFTAEPRDIKAFAHEINRCWESIDPNYKGDLRRLALQFFDNQASARAMKALCEKVLARRDEPKWNAMSITADDWRLLSKFIKEYNIKSVVEFGAGISTELFDKMGLKVTSYETDEKWAEAMRRKIPHGKISSGTLIEDWDGKSSVPVEADLAFIDGPHGGKNREPAYKSVFSSKIKYVACHDASRPEDRVWIDKYFFGWPLIAENADTVILERPNALQ